VIVATTIARPKVKVQERDINGETYRRLHQRSTEAKISAKANPHSESNILTRQTPRFPLNGIRLKFMSLRAKLLDQSGFGISPPFYPISSKNQ
jgi:HD superfamily phosphohydrolase